MKAAKSAVRATMIGTDVAISERKTKSRTRNAASSPRLSDVPCSSGGNSASPLNSTSSPAASPISRAASSTATTWSRSLSVITSLNWAWK